MEALQKIKYECKEKNQRWVEEAYQYMAEQDI